LLASNRKNEGKLNLRNFKGVQEIAPLFIGCVTQQILQIDPPDNHRTEALQGSNSACLTKYLLCSGCLALANVVNANAGIYTLKFPAFLYSIKFA